MYTDHMNGTDWTVMGLWMLFAVVLVALLVFLLASRTRRQCAPPAPPPQARDVLDERLARGEIDVEDYHRRRTAIDHPEGSAQ